MSSENFVRGSISKPLRRARSNLRPTFRSFTRTSSRQMQKLVRAHTPVDTGELMDSIQPKDVVETRDEFSGGVHSDAPYASFVEDDTKPHRIPKEGSESKPISFWSNGRRVTVPFVMHPGTKGQHMFAKGVADMEAILPDQGEELIKDWAKRNGL
jgi:bacteriophage HK97-gp10 putative tail-component